MITDTTQNSGDHASKDVQTTTVKKAPPKDIGTKSAIADGNDIDSAEPTPEEKAKSKDDDDEDDGEDHEVENVGEEEEDEDEDSDDSDDDFPKFEGGEPRGRIITRG